VNKPILTYLLIIALAFATLLFAGQLRNIYLPGDQRGYEPEQPIDYSHRLHAGELQISCLYCHSGAETSRHAGIPSSNVCMNCHQFVTASLGAVRAEEEQAGKEGRAPRRLVSPDLRKLYDAMGLDENLRAGANGEARGLEWVRVHKLPDYVYFDHRAHTTAGVSCQQCHGPVETMERVRQVSSLSMGWCVNCHRQSSESGVAGRRVNASIDCAVCHF
jgi:hypothetical protein